jgi:hypothetical protein
MHRIIVNVQSEDIDIQTICELMQEILEEELPIATDGDIDTIQVVYDEATSGDVPS